MNVFGLIGMIQDEAAAVETAAETAGGIDWSNIDWKSLIIEYGTGLVKFLAVLVIGLWVAKMLTKLFGRILKKNENIDDSLRGFLVSIIGTVLKILVWISALGMLGIEMTSFIAILGAAGLAIGMALSGTLQNFAGGVMLLLFKPFKVGDLITAQGHTGHVDEIQVFVTKLVTPQNQTVILPNGPLSNGDIVNVSAKGVVRVDLAMGIGYGESITQAKEVIMKVMTDNPKVLSDPAPVIGVSGHGASSVDLAVMPYCKPADYWDVYFSVYENGKVALDEAGIDIPYPQTVMHQAAN